MKKAINDFIRIAGALSDMNRIRALLAIEQGELCACDIIRLLRLAPSTVSKHMGLLQSAGLVSGRKNGRWMHYSLPGKEAGKSVREALKLTRNLLKNDSVILKDNTFLSKYMDTCDPDKRRTKIKCNIKRLKKK